MLESGILTASSSFFLKERAEAQFTLNVAGMKQAEAQMKPMIPKID